MNARDKTNDNVTYFCQSEIKFSDGKVIMFKKRPHNKKNPVYRFFNSVGLTLIELIVVTAIIGVLATMAIPIYQNFKDKARITVAQATLDTFRVILVDYSNEGTGSYPTTIDFVTGLDNQGATVIQQPLRDQIRNDLILSSMNYIRTTSGFTLTAQAKDKAQTVLILTENTLKIQGQ